ncbi:cell division protein [Alkalihalobacillus alcalophilus ATCC 27647 = CGMCC 1.3604]|uniref:Cell division protein n=2 Tax=Alkalihalobacillus alcalophilus TaxID=1445 RepID=A0A4S4K5C1_ALKAL|nr:cell division protein FtsA [Alkalihalobacillus alcalophilus]MED1564223.1 cell division protein FtsA [Alkalihalobacillus alcalophilus]THG92267.1 cell division protein [Alkalihalobacillus alcalophilus ATCC 27647 = CGMCC 1.3604]
MEPYKQPPLFALDIGTRSVVALLLQPHEDQFELIDIEIIEHKERSMLDGQIHDIPAVAAAIKKVKETLEEKHGPLKKVCVAAAGRSLKTRRAQFELDVKGKPILNPEDVLHLELSAVQKAQFELAQTEIKESSLHYFCVGYSVLNYQMDGEIIGSLVDQNGDHASVEVIATFLPKIVVESLLSALTRADLELEALTLEPIAAINVLIPPSMRRLNVALVDIGAGTSDIAITDENTVVAYGMVPVAGDEITEAVSDQFLLDFPEAERVKRQIHTEDTIQIADILGFETEYTKEEMVAPIRANIRHLAQKISHEILELNGKPPKAVMLVGGGSLTPELPKHVAELLRLPENRVAIRGIEAIQKLKKTTTNSIGPELVTPIGIAIAAKENPIEYLSITVNNKKLRLFDIKNLTVGDALLAAGVDIAKLYGKPGLAKIVTIQQKVTTIPGELGHAPTILRNGETTSLHAVIQANDEIVVMPGEDGKEVTVTIAEIYGDVPTLPLLINGEIAEIPGYFLQNGKRIKKEAILNDRDIITIQYPETIKDVLNSLSIEPKTFEPIMIQFAGKEQTLFHPTQQILLNKTKSTLSTRVHRNDSLTIPEFNKEIEWTLQHIVHTLQIEEEKRIQVFFNDELITLTKPIFQYYREEALLTKEAKIYNGDKITVKSIGDGLFILQDIFAVQEVIIPENSRKQIELYKNGQQTGFAEQIIDGDKIQLIIK